VTAKRGFELLGFRITSLAQRTGQRGAQLATSQGNYVLARKLESNMDLYRRTLPLRDTGE